MDSLEIGSAMVMGIKIGDVIQVDPNGGAGVGNYGGTFVIVEEVGDSDIKGYMPMAKYEDGTTPIEKITVAKSLCHTIGPAKWQLQMDSMAD